MLYTINNNSTYTLSTYTTYNSTYTLTYVCCGSLGPPQAENWLGL